VLALLWCALCGARVRATHRLSARAHATPVQADAGVCGAEMRWRWWTRLRLHVSEQMRVLVLCSR
jgi:hypothetical protein